MRKTRSIPLVAGWALALLAKACGQSSTSATPILGGNGLQLLLVNAATDPWTVTPLLPNP